MAVRMMIPVAHHSGDAVLTTILGGIAESHKLTISREILGINALIWSKLVALTFYVDSVLCFGTGKKDPPVMMLLSDHPLGCEVLKVGKSVSCVNKPPNEGQTIKAISIGK